MRILIVADSLPYPLISGDRIRIYNLLRRVASRHEVSLAALLEQPGDIEGVPHLQQFCERVETAGLPQGSRLAKAPGMLRYALQGKPPELRLLSSVEFAGKITELVSTTDFDIVQIENSRMGLYLEVIPQKRRRRSILMLHNVTFQQHRRVSRFEKRWDRRMRFLLDSVAMHRWEPRYSERFDRCVTVSEMDRQLLMSANPRLRVDVIPNGVDIEKYEPLPLPTSSTSTRLLFIGNMGYPPCVDAASYFCSEILPRVRRMMPAAEFWIVGRDPAPEVLRLDGDGVHVTGQVADVIPYYRQSAICVVPLRAGGGTRLKILEAMALGRPVVSTTIGCEGLEVRDGEHLLVADTPELFAQKAVNLVTERQLYQHIYTKGRQLVEARYDWDKIAGQLMKVYDELVNEQVRLHPQAHGGPTD